MQFQPHLNVFPVNESDQKYVKRAAVVAGINKPERDLTCEAAAIGSVFVQLEKVKQ